MTKDIYPRFQLRATPCGTYHKYRILSGRSDTIFTVWHRPPHPLGLPLVVGRPLDRENSNDHT